MSQSVKYQDVGKMAFRVMGACAVVAFLFFNPLVLRPRIWNLSVVANSWAIDSALLVGGFGLFYRRKWAAVLSSVAAVYIALATSRRIADMNIADAISLLLLLLPLLFSVPFWRTLIWGSRRRDPLFASAGVAISGLVELLAFLIHPAR